MRVLLAGPGAIGCMFAARLSDAGADVVLLDHDRSRCGRLAADGLHVERTDGVRTYRVDVVCAGDALPPGTPVTAAIIAVKAWDTSTAGAAVAAMVRPDTPVVSLQNGIGNAETLADACGLHRVICATTACGAVRLGEGRVREEGLGTTRMAAVAGPMPDEVAALACALTRAGLAVEFHADARAVVWSKAVINAAINPLTAVWGVPNGELAEREDLRATMHAAADEGQRVAAALGIDLVYDDAAAEAGRVCRQTRANLSSMLQDVRAGRRTEIRHINGAIVEAARLVGVATPVNEDLLRKVLALEPA